MSVGVLVAATLSVLVIGKAAQALADSTRHSPSIGAGIGIVMAIFCLIGVGLVATLAAGVVGFSIGLAFAHKWLAGKSPWWAFLGYPLLALQLGAVVYGYLWYRGLLESGRKMQQTVAARRVKELAASPQRVAPTGVRPPNPTQSSAPAATMPPVLTAEESASAKTEVPALLGAFYYPDSEVSTMSQRSARSEQGNQWPSITMVPPENVSPDEIIAYYRQLAPEASNDAPEVYRANMERPGDGAHAIVYVFRAMYGPEAGRMVVMVMSP